MEIFRRIAEIQEVQRFQETKKAERAETQLPRYCLSERLTDFVISSNTYSDLVVEKTRIEEIIELVEYFILEKTQYFRQRYCNKTYFDIRNYYLSPFYLILGV